MAAIKILAKTKADGIIDIALNATLFLSFQDLSMAVLGRAPLNGRPVPVAPGQKYNFGTSSLCVNNALY